MLHTETITIHRYPILSCYQNIRAFELAGQRYEELKPVLDRLNELEEKQVRGQFCLL